MIYVLIAQGFEEIEALAVVDILRRAELNVKMVGIGGDSITGAHGIPVICDLSCASATTDGLEMVVLPGGMPGTLNLEKSSVVQSLVDYATEQNIWLAAICAAPSILGHKGILRSKNATCFPGFEEQMEGANAKPDRVVQDGKLITGKGPGAAIPFALKLVECLVGKEKAEHLEASLQ